MSKSQVKRLNIKIFADGAQAEDIFALAKDAGIKGFTTNPTLMRAAGIEDYEAFAHSVLEVIKDHPISFEVFADDLASMEAQARTIASWGENVYVKVPVTNTQGEFTGPIIEKLSAAGVKLNITAVMTPDQVRQIVAALHLDTPSVVSVFAGRVADTGVDPVPVMRECVDILKARPKAELLWASPRELLNIFQADEIGCHIITVTPDLLKKLQFVGKDLIQYSLETVKMFYNDASSAGYSIRVNSAAAAE